MSAKLSRKAPEPPGPPLTPRDRLADLLGRLLARDWLVRQKDEPPGGLTDEPAADVPGPVKERKESRSRRTSVKTQPPLETRDRL